VNDLRLCLEWARGTGGLAPYFEGLGAGIARATCCPGCHRTWFPPRLACTCGRVELQWRTLPGSGIVRAVTAGPGRLPGEEPTRTLVLALVAVEGADNAVLGRIEPPIAPAVGAGVRLIADTLRGRPAWSAVFTPC